MNAETRRFTRVSGRAEAILGYPVERWRSVPGFWIGVLHPDDRERVAHAVWRALHDRTPCEIEYRAVAADGSVVRLRDRVRVSLDPDGSGLVLQGATTDLTTRARPAVAAPPWAPRRWRRGRYAMPIAAPPEPAREPGPPVSGDRAELPFESAPAEPITPELVPADMPGAAPPSAPVPAAVTGIGADRLLERLGEAVVASDADHRIVYWNPAAEALLGVPAAVALGKSDAELLHTRTSAGQTAEILAGLLGRRPWSAEVSLTDASGQSIPVRITASALRNGDAVAGYVAVITDLREVRRGEAVRGAAAAMEAVARLARGVALELDDSVTRIETAVRSALARVGPEAPGRPGLDDALRHVDATASLAEQLRAVGRAASINPVRLDPRDTLRRTLPSIRLLARDDVEIVMELDPATPQVLADPAALSQILLNIAADCATAMTGAGRLTLRTGGSDISRRGGGGIVSGASPGDWVVVEVQDSRRLADSKALDRFFEPFDEAGTTPPGMGLAAAHGLAVASGGQLSVDTARPEGLIFRLYLPPAPASRT